MPPGFRRWNPRAARVRSGGLGDDDEQCRRGGVQLGAG